MNHQSPWPWSRLGLALHRARLGVPTFLPRSAWELPKQVSQTHIISFKDKETFERTISHLMYFHGMGGIFFCSGATFEGERARYWVGGIIKLTVEDRGGGAKINNVCCHSWMEIDTFHRRWIQQHSKKSPRIGNDSREKKALPRWTNDVTRSACYYSLLAGKKLGP